MPNSVNLHGFPMFLAVQNTSVNSFSFTCIGSACLDRFELHTRKGSRLTTATEVSVHQNNPTCVCRAASSVASSQDSPSSNAAEAPQLDDYVGRHASPQRMLSGGSVISQGQDHDIPYAPKHDSPQLPRQKSGLWGVESNPSRQPSIAARASSPPQRQKSQSSQLSGTLRTGSGASSKHRAKSDVDSRVESTVEPRVESRIEPRAEPRVPERHVRKSPVRAPSRLRESSTEEAEVQYAPPPRNTHQSSQDSSAEEEEEPLCQKPFKQTLQTDVTTDDEEPQTLRHRHSPRALHSPRQKSKGTTTQAHQRYHTAEEYFSRARVREALSPHRQPAHHRQYPAKARILDLHDNCTLADEQEDDLCCGAGSSQRKRDSSQGCAQVCGLAGKSLCI